MWSIAVWMLVAFVVAGVVLVYVAYPHLSSSSVGQSARRPVRDADARSTREQESHDLIG